MVEAAKQAAAHLRIFTTSSETGSGIAELRTAILEAATLPRERDLLKLIIGNRAYSSWSMRGWLAVKQSGEEFEELGRSAVRRGLGEAPRGRRVRAIAR